MTERVLRLSVYHCFNPDKPEAEVHEFVTNDHAVKAAKIHQKHGLLGYTLYFAPQSAQKVLSDWKRVGGRNWELDTYDACVEFYFTDFAVMGAIAQDPDFGKLQEAELPFLDASRPPRAHLGWVQAYIHDGQIINVEGSKSVFPPFTELSQIVFPGVSEGK
ncbi:hypothetical protein AAWM_00014 [Aspergillus awamori]|uniref:EthD domain-containing protein n=3 Tax=Aspergillus TaxID=5052 RepID=A0A401KD42_ASPAW|nr:hypothetical protein CBS147346_2327 [Aspergillus niger]RDK38262.1 hypothetical protein M752DRAFT_279196 [Aspergillus phoenicis ATCC 13157]GCB17129.1 hypothetical protein AAWM_00014 [Aspergillus awamori]GKZ61431.1 hypothetical protein AnigIFM49718_008147 [Aspergillus niger]GLA28523.1 hypothetical protein AnigIFM63326_006102 [Aspergillus niger]